MNRKNIGEFREVPGPQSKKVIEETNEYLATTTNNSRLTVKCGWGATLLDEDLNAYLDFTSGVGCANIGHSNRDVASAIYGQSLVLPQYINTDFHNSLPNRVAKKLSEITPGKFPKKVFFANSGAEAVEAAVKLVFSHYSPSHREAEFMASHGAFHGRTGFALPLMDPSKQVRLEHYPMAYKVHHYGFPTPQAAQEVLEKIKNDFDSGALDKVAGIIFEPIQGEGGIILPDGKVLLEIVNLCHSKGIVVIADEVQTGFGRTGKMFACEHFSIEPDVICVAKAFGMGIPAGAIIFRASLDWDKLGRHSNTNGGNNVAMAAFLVGIGVMENQRLVERAVKMGEILGEYLKQLYYEYSYPGIVDARSAAIITDTRGLGLMQAIEFATPELRDVVIDNALDYGLVLICAGYKAIRLMPPLVINEDELKMAIIILERAIDLTIGRKI